MLKCQVYYTDYCSKITFQFNLYVFMLLLSRHDIMSRSICSGQKFSFDLLANNTDNKSHSSICGWHNRAICGEFYVSMT